MTAGPAGLAELSRGVGERDVDTGLLVRGIQAGHSVQGFA
jgi:hypothetical protein